MNTPLTPPAPSTPRGEPICPLCGGEIYVRQVGNNYTKQRGWDTGCDKCRIHKQDRVIRETNEWLLPKALETWFKRPAQAAPSEEEEREIIAEAIRNQGFTVSTSYSLADNIIRALTSQNRGGR